MQPAITIKVIAGCIYFIGIIASQQCCHILLVAWSFPLPIKIDLWELKIQTAD